MTWRCICGLSGLGGAEALHLHVLSHPFSIRLRWFFARVIIRCARWLERLGYTFQGVKE